jgi:hypothetical protein
MHTLTIEYETIREHNAVRVENDYTESDGPNYFLVGGPYPNYNKPNLTGSVFNE